MSVGRVFAVVLETPKSQMKKEGAEVYPRTRNELRGLPVLGLPAAGRCGLTILLDVSLKVCSASELAGVD